MTIEMGLVRVTFCVTPQDTLNDVIDLYEVHNGEWKFVRGVSVTPLPRLHEAEIGALLKEGRHDEIESYRYPEPMRAVVDHVDYMLKGLGWSRVGEIHTFPLEHPMRPGSTPNRFADVEVRRGWRERRYLSALDRTLQERREEGRREVKRVAAIKRAKTRRANS